MSDMEGYRMTTKELFSLTGSGEGGLTEEEAARRLAKNGKNQLPEKKKQSLALLFFGQFKDVMTIILVCAAVVSGALAFSAKDGNGLLDTAILLFIILLNAVVGTVQQYRADKAIEGLKKMSICRATVLRDGMFREIDGSEVVVGDILSVSEGNKIPADGRLLAAESFYADESALTGESRSVFKYPCDLGEVALADRKNFLFSSTYCVRGEGKMLVTATGKDTEMGKIAKLMGEEKPDPSPLDKTIAGLGKLITLTVLVVAAVLFLVGLFVHGTGFLDNLMNSVAVAVAAIPEGMGAVVTVIMALGVKRMSEQRAIVRKLSAVETLGSCSYICSDKTGTLTQNKMKVAFAEADFFGGKEGKDREKRLLACMRICESVKGKKGEYFGDNMEVALVEYAESRGMVAPYREISTLPFTSERKMMSVLAEYENKTLLFCKGSAEVILGKCSYLAEEGGKRRLTPSEKQKIADHVREICRKGYRALAFAEGEREEKELTFCGIAALQDPPKKGVKEGVEVCRRAGIRTVMITGDSADTALAIARELGIASSEREVIEGKELDELGDRLAEEVTSYRVFARVTPVHKLKIVRALQKRGEVVAMTGDGVNDAPSLKVADIGVAMGSGTEIAKNASDMVIADDNFSTVERAVEEGRNVFFNVKRTIDFFLATNLAEVFSVLIATVFFASAGFLTSTQLLWINLITDSLPVLALGVERTGGVMLRPPVSAREILGKRSLCKLLVYGLIQTAIAVGLFSSFVLQGKGELARTAAFLTLSFVELFHGFNVRRDSGSPFYSNRVFVFTLLVGVFVNVLLVASPFLRTAFGLCALSIKEWLLILGCSAAIIPLGGIVEKIFKKREKQTRWSDNNVLSRGARRQCSSAARNRAKEG